MTKPPINNIIWDLDGVLITTHLYKAFWHIGPIKLLSYLTKHSLSDIEHSYFCFLATLKPWHDTSPLVISIKGNRLPCLMTDYQQGFINSKKILDMINTALKNEKYSSNKGFYWAMSRLIFDPHTFIRCYKPIYPVIDILMRSKNACHKDGSPKNRLFLITNFDEESFNYLMADPMYHSFLSLFEGIIVSGVVHALKPERNIFDILFHTYSINPTQQTTLYIDDNSQNIDAAHSYFPTLHCFQYLPKTHHTLEEKLQQLSML